MGDQHSFGSTNKHCRSGKASWLHRASIRGVPRLARLYWRISALLTHIVSTMPLGRDIHSVAAPRGRRSDGPQHVTVLPQRIACMFGWTTEFDRAEAASAAICRQWAQPLPARLPAAIPKCNALFATAPFSPSTTNVNSSALPQLHSQSWFGCAFCLGDPWLARSMRPAR